MSRRPLTTSAAYTLAHTAQCKLKLAANRPDRNLRFVLGHAFTLDNLMLRIVEIENQSAKSMFQEGVKAPSDHGDEHYDCTAPKPLQRDPQFDHSQSKPTAAEPTPTERGRRISFQDNNARPSSTAGVASNNSTSTSSPARKRSPPPSSIPAVQQYLSESDSDGSSSDDYDDPASYLRSPPAAVEGDDNDNDPTTQTPPKHRPVHDAYSDEEDAALELADDELDDPDAADEMGALSLTRFESATARPPRMVRSRASSSSSSASDEDADAAEPITPPQLPEDVDVRELIGGDRDDDLVDLYESVRRCACHGHKEEEVGGAAQAVWDVPVSEKTGGRHLAVVAIAA